MKKNAAFLVILVAVFTALSFTPVHAGRSLGTGNFTHASRVELFAPAFGFPLEREVPTGEWQDIQGGWVTATDEQLQDFMQNASVQMTFDGQPVEFEADVGTAPWGDPRVKYHFLSHPRSPGIYEAEITFTFLKDHFDGFELIPAGTVITGTRLIVVTPRDQYPSGDYPETPF